jgi:aryl-alcohol dehydrogenase-like predicted oxidoreductase
METRRIGTIEVSVVGLGCNNFGMAIDVDATRAVVDAAIEAGINYFDTAESYGQGQSEEYLGRALAGRRDEVLVATKWGHTASLAEGERGGDPELVRRSLDASLQRLGMDHVDHYQLHRPDPDTPITETLGVLDELRRAGKVREIGCTAFSADQLRDALDAGAAAGVAAFPSVQNHYSLLTRDPERDGVLELCAEAGVAFVPYFPLESGLLTGKYKAGQPLPEDSRLARWGPRSKAFIDDDKLAVVARLEAWAEARGHTLLELAMSYLASNPTVSSVIAGCTSPAQVRSNVAAATWALTEAERDEVRALVDAGATTG